MLDEKMEKTNDKIMDMCEERKCDVEVFEDSNIEKCSFENDKQDDISFISDIEFGLDDEMKPEEKHSIEKRFKPSMKMVFRHKENNNYNIPDNTLELLFDINMIKSEPNKILKEFSSLKTVNKLFKFGNLNDICIKPFTKSEIDPKYIEKRKSSNDTILKTGYLSLDYEHIGCNYYPEITNIIYVNMKRWFTDLCITLPSYDYKKNIKVVGLLFSGGKDSTCRLLELLEQGEHVVPIINTFNSHYSTCLLIRDLSTVYNLSKIYETKKFKGTLYKPKFLSYLSYAFDLDHVGLTQQPYNIMSLTLLGNNFLNNCKRIECCLINGDTGVSYISEMTKLYKTVMKFNYHVINGGVKSIPPLVFPYIKLVKGDIVNKLKTRFKNIFSSKQMYTIFPSCEFIDVQFIKIAFSEHRYWLYVSLKNCGICEYCKTYSSNYYNTLCIPLSEIKPINKNGIILSEKQIRDINSKFSNSFEAY